MKKKRRLPALIRMEADPSSVWKSDKKLIVIQVVALLFCNPADPFGRSLCRLIKVTALVDLKSNRNI